ncbi:MAG TPA: peptidylprolyl isomerase, partial [Polyangiaceae bacterium]|nr:peptidylprolyl isomerase [Polyangiaceae bacterium]
GERGGDLGVFDRSTMVKTFADAAFELGVGQVSGIIETVYGFHIIKRTE